MANKTRRVYEIGSYWGESEEKAFSTRAEYKWRKAEIEDWNIYVVVLEEVSKGVWDEVSRVVLKEDIEEDIKKLTDVEISCKYGIPTRTLQDWKNKDKDNWRSKVYLSLKNE